jgi:hypothetical protein
MDQYFMRTSIVRYSSVFWTSLAVAVFSTVVMSQAIKPTDWAAAQNGIGNTLKEQASSAEGPEAVRLFGEAAAAYRRALQVFTRDSMPQDWATTQHNLGYVLQEQGVRTNGAEAARLLSDAVAAYKHALQIRTREQLPLHWAMTQNDLGNALQAQGVRAEGRTRSDC